jgi:hypothetical protein
MLRKKTAVVATGLALALATAAIAFAYWTNGGSGAGTASAGSDVAITVNQTSDVAGLYPGGPAADLAGDFTNTNDSKVYVHQVVATLASVSGGGAYPSQPACTTADFALSNGGTALVDAEVPSGSGVGTWSGISVRLLDTSANQDNCKNATVHISYVSN